MEFECAESFAMWNAIWPPLDSPGSPAEEKAVTNFGFTRQPEPRCCYRGQKAIFSPTTWTNTYDKRFWQARMPRFFPVTLGI